MISKRMFNCIKGIRNLSLSSLVFCIMFFFGGLVQKEHNTICILGIATIVSLVIAISTIIILHINYNVYNQRKRGRIKPTSLFFEFIV